MNSLKLDRLSDLAASTTVEIVRFPPLEGAIRAVFSGPRGSIMCVAVNAQEISERDERGVMVELDERSFLRSDAEQSHVRQFGKAFVVRAVYDVELRAVVGITLDTEEGPILLASGDMPHTMYVSLLGDRYGEPEYPSLAG